ncbi:MAG TPA: CoA pyrophosphatase [Reyranella sp.]
MRDRSDRLASGLPVPAPPIGSDFSLSGIVPVPDTWKPASVLVPLVDRAEGVTVLLTQRTADMPSHAGQIAFPGGRREAGEDAVATALRETQEEVGITRDFIDVVGAVDLYHTGTGFEITPVVGILTPGFTVVAQAREVADVFEVPLDHFLNEVNHQIGSREYQGRERRYYAMPYGDRYIWGATAGMLKNLYFILTATETAAA